MIVGIASAAEFPDRGHRIVRRCVSQREDDSFRTELRMRAFAAVFDGESCDRYDLALDMGAGVELHAQHP
jgi:hypothetical protein